MYHSPVASTPPHSHGTHRSFLSLSRTYIPLFPPGPAGVPLSRSRWSPVSPLEICSPSFPLNSTAHRRKLRGSQPININDISIHRNNVANYGRPYYRGCLSLSLSLYPSLVSVLPFFVSLTHLVGTGECGLLFDGNNYCQDLPRALRAGTNEGEKRTEESTTRVVDGTYECVSDIEN